MRRGSRASEKPLPITLISRHNAQFQACAGTAPPRSIWRALNRSRLGRSECRIPSAQFRAWAAGPSVDMGGW